MGGFLSRRICLYGFVRYFLLPYLEGKRIGRFRLKKGKTVWILVVRGKNWPLGLYVAQQRAKTSKMVHTPFVERY